MCNKCKLYMTISWSSAELLTCGSIPLQHRVWFLPRAYEQCCVRIMKKTISKIKELSQTQYPLFYVSC